MSNPSPTLSAIAQLVGLPYDSSLLISGGTLVLYVGRPIAAPWRAEWHVWIDCAWRMEHQGKVVAGSRDDEQLILPRLAGLKGSTVAAIDVDEARGDLHLVFSNGSVIRNLTSSLLDEQWELRRADGYRLSLGPGARFSERMEAPVVSELQGPDATRGDGK